MSSLPSRGEVWWCELAGVGRRPVVVAGSVEPGSEDGSAKLNHVIDQRPGRIAMERRTKQPTAKGPAEWFTGEVWIDPIAQGPPPSKVNVGAVHFTPGARTAWHSHDGGQTLYVTEGRGLVQSRGEPAVEIRPGDVISTPDGEEHWHGATPDHFMTHLTITEGGPHWGDHVSDADYRAATEPNRNPD